MEPPQLRPFNPNPSPMIHQDPNGQQHVPVIHLDGPPPETASSKGHGSHRGRYKEKFTAMREKYEKATRAQEVLQKQFEVANARIKKLQAENDLLLDAMLVNDEALFNRFFPSTNHPNAPLPPGIARDHHHTHHRHGGPPPPPPLHGLNAPPPRHPGHNPNHYMSPEGPNNQHHQLRTPIERESENLSAGTIRIIPGGSNPRRSRRHSQSQQHAPSIPAPSHPNAEPSSGVGTPYGRYPIMHEAQSNGSGTNGGNGNGGSARPGSPHPPLPPPPPGPANPNHIINLGAPLPPQHVNGSGGSNDALPMPPPSTQVPLYDRPLEFIQHEPNGRA